jgi:hypothetical protein
MVVNRAVREGAGAKAGQRVVVEMDRNDEPRDVVPPDAFEAALARYPTARAAYDAVAYSHRKEYVAWITEPSARRRERAGSRRPSGC